MTPLVIPLLCWRRTSITTSRRSMETPGYAHSLTCTWWYTSLRIRQLRPYNSLDNLSPCLRGLATYQGVGVVLKGVEVTCFVGITLRGRSNTCVEGVRERGFQAWTDQPAHSRMYMHY